MVEMFYFKNADSVITQEVFHCHFNILCHGDIPCRNMRESCGQGTFDQLLLHAKRDAGRTKDFTDYCQSELSLSRLREFAVKLGAVKNG